MPQRHIKRLLILSAGLLASAAQANLVTNGGFETGDFSGWTGLGPTGSFSSSMVVESSVAVPYEGDYVAQFYFGGNAKGISQILDTVAGQTYTVSFWLKNSRDCTGICWFDFNWDGQSVFTSSHEPVFDYKQFTYELQASSSSTLLQFYLGNRIAPILLDDISVEPVVTEESVPEPATMALTLVALLGAGAFSRRHA